MEKENQICADPKCGHKEDRHKNKWFYVINTDSKGDITLCPCKKFKPKFDEKKFEKELKNWQKEGEPQNHSQQGNLATLNPKNMLTNVAKESVDTTNRNEADTSTLSDKIHEGNRLIVADARESIKLLKEEFKSDRSGMYTFDFIHSRIDKIFGEKLA